MSLKGLSRNETEKQEAGRKLQAERTDYATMTKRH